MNPPASLLLIDDIVIDVVRKPVKNLSLRVVPPDGAVRLTAPLRASDRAIDAFARAKRAWIVRHRERIRAQTSASSFAYVDGEQHMVWGRPHTLSIEQRNGRSTVRLIDDRLIVAIRPGTDVAAVLARWQRSEVLERGAQLIRVWEPIMRVRSSGLSVRRMKTRWGSCTPGTGTIRLNAALAAKPPECIEYVVVHELAHLLELSHGPRFIALMDRFLPDWRHRRRLLNRGVPG